MITIYKTPVCPRCKQLTAYLDGIGCRYEEATLEDAGVIAEMRCSGFFGMMAPVIENSSGYHGPEEFFDGGVLNTEKLGRLL